jgi:CRP/FNR family transcriptional regulator
LSDLDSLAAKLQTVPMLQGLDRASLAQLATSAVRRVYPPGSIIFLEGESGPALYYVDSGWVKIVKMSGDGREQILYVMGPGEIFGGIGVFIDRPAPATAITLETTETWMLQHDAIRRVFATNPALALSVIEYLASRIGELVDMVADLSLRSVTERLARLLLDQAEGDVIQRQRWATQAEMAARLGTVPEVLNRSLRTLVEAELIEFSRNQIRILDRQALADKAERNR